MRIIVPFNLKPGVDFAEYEQWARSEDLPTASALPSVRSFTLHKSVGLLGAPDGTAPYAYFEILDITDLNAFLADISDPHFQSKAAPFRDYADNPVFILTEDL